MKKQATTPERKFLHDIATPISIIRLHAKRLKKTIEERNPSEVESKLLAQILKSIEDLEDLHSERKYELENVKAS